MANVQEGDTVRIHYQSQLDDGTPVGSTEGEEPVEIQTGKGQLFPKLEEEICGMSPGEDKTTTLQPEEAFGQYRQELVTEIGLEEFTSRGIEPYTGLALEIPTNDGETFQAKVTDITDEKVKFQSSLGGSFHYLFCQSCGYCVML